MLSKIYKLNNEIIFLTNSERNYVLYLYSVKNKNVFSDINSFFKKKNIVFYKKQLCIYKKTTSNLIIILKYKFFFEKSIKVLNQIQNSLNIIIVKNKLFLYYLNNTNVSIILKMSSVFKLWKLFFYYYRTLNIFKNIFFVSNREDGD